MHSLAARLRTAVDRAANRREHRDVAARVAVHDVVELGHLIRKLKGVKGVVNVERAA